jgi:hypothetical protein
LISSSATSTSISPDASVDRSASLLISISRTDWGSEAAADLDVERGQASSSC